jgi:transcription-repair coupling factor (superfamily II helicase)
VALALAEVAAAARGPLAVFAEDAAQLERLEAELAFFMPRDLPLLAFPDYETLPYDRFSPHPDIISQRLRTLARLPMFARGIVLADLPTAMQAPGAAQFHRCALAYTRRRRGARSRAVSTPADGPPVMPASRRSVHRGEFAIRGSLFDLLPMGSDAPLRIDLDDRRIDSIRSFDSETQRTTGRLERIELLRAREFRLAPDSIRDFRRRFRTRFEGDLTRMPVLPRRRRRARTRGHRVLLAALLRVHLHALRLSSDDALLVLPENTRRRAGCGDAPRFEERHEEHRYDIEHPVLAPPELFLEPQNGLHGRAHDRMRSLRPPTPRRTRRLRPDRWSRRVTRPTSASISGTRTASRRLQPPCARASPGSCLRPNRRAAASCCSICCARMESRPG